jgi:hypothetical protein
MKSNRTLHNDQSGLVSIVVTMVMIFVLTLVVLAFARLVQREQRQTLDRQLNTQAFYAAETGVNDAVYYLRSFPAGSVPAISDTNCEPLSPGVNQLDGTNVVYSCQLIDTSPPRLKYSTIKKDETKVIPIRIAGNPAPAVSDLSIYWQEAEGGESWNGCQGDSIPTFPSTWPTSCSPGVLRFDLVHIPGPAFSRDNLIEEVATVFAVPKDGGNAEVVNFSDASGFSNSTSAGGHSHRTYDQGVIKAGSCAPTSGTRPEQCHIRISGLSGNLYYLRITPIYKSASVTICADTNCASPSKELEGAQAVIDSTGRASDVLRRIQVRIGISTLDGLFPLYGVESYEKVCKRLIIAPPNNVEDECGDIVDDPTPGGGGGPGAGIGTCADFGTCPPSRPGLPRPPLTWRYDVALYNTSNNPERTVLRCEWDWGDSKPPENESCNYGQPNYYCYLSTTPYPSATPTNPMRYTVKLTVYFTDGTSATSVPRQVKAPYASSSASPTCSRPIPPSP